MVHLFPQKSYQNIQDYYQDYLRTLVEIGTSLDLVQLDQAAKILAEAMRGRKCIYTCGNGGSAAIANHFQVDYSKGIATHTELEPKVFSLSGEMSTLSAIANDIGYDEVFSYQLERKLEPGDVVLAISSSGNSPNIVRALEVARKKGNATILLSGFEGGKAKEHSDVCIYYPVANYGVVEDLHHVSMHILAQFIRMNHLQPEQKIDSMRF